MNSIKRIFAGCAVLAAAAVSVSSCGLYGKYKPEVEVKREEVKIPSYTEIFREPELQRLIDSALVNNADLKMAHERVRQAEIALTAAKLAYLPRVFAGDNSAAVFHDSKSGISVKDSKSWAYTFGSASWELDIFGRITNRKRIAKSEREMARDFEQAARVELVSAVATTYYELLVIDAQIAATDSAEANWKKSVETMRDLKQAGLNDEAAVAQFEGSYYATKVQAKSLRLLRDQVENAMRLYLFNGDCPIERGSIDINGGSLRIEGECLKSVDLRALRVRPDVRAAERQLEQAFYNVNLSRAECCPSIRISGNIGWVGEQVVYGLVGGLLQPIFNAGENIARLKVSKSKYEELKTNYAFALFKAGMQTNDALSACRWHNEQVEDCRLRVSSMKRALEATQLKMDFGRGTYLEVLTAQNDLLNAQMAAIRNAGDVRLSYVDLYQALGGGQE